MEYYFFTLWIAVMAFYCYKLFAAHKSLKKVEYNNAHKLKEKQIKIHK
ncbi:MULTISPECIES: hypothetical protein [Cellulophaga]|uniref:Uncharacterized protein n=2 Tax=Cellulophaga TaxID=104264 RepID=F0RI60_CELLC|nr:MULTISPECIES: hypothetical protein [Cellulophaga]ADY30341.1 hypothetical protein Celly_2524 [Cellulophaga lytica DSM 7489]EWH14333.1 hypothetical protein KLA_04911 [Cellulophaga geojensis KL-A]MDO6854582.1 hypothetical protein [Cellulophaga lytica]TVZ10350.1 hypothetical protein JM80_2888 [Cellulophaga sp. RHA_52]WBU88711.1 hypothetical protein PBN93_12640 [Cellulophaga omnivescoria]